MTRIVCISDTHGHHDRISVPDGDILVHSGDFTNRGEVNEVVMFLRWLNAQPLQFKVLIAGNHDFLFEREARTARLLIEEHAPSVTYLNDSGFSIAGIKFWGSPVQPRFYDWAFNCDRGPDIQRHWDLIPSDTEVLVTHGPPMGILDTVDSGKGEGCANLLMTIERLPKLKLHTFGHLHADGGRWIKKETTTFVNASICDEDYKPVRAPIVVTLNQDRAPSTYRND